MLLYGERRKSAEMSIFKRNKKASRGESSSVISVGTRDKVNYSFNHTMPEISLYKALRENIPIIDVGILKIRRLLGEFKVCCENKETELRLKSCDTWAQLRHSTRDPQTRDGTRVPCIADRFLTTEPPEKSHTLHLY